MNLREHPERNTYGLTGKYHISSKAKYLSPPLCPEGNNVPGAASSRSVCLSARKIFLLQKKTLIGQDAKLSRGEFRFCLKLRHFFGHTTKIMIALTQTSVAAIMVSLTWLITMLQQAAHLLPARIVVRG